MSYQRRYATLGGRTSWIMTLVIELLEQSDKIDQNQPT
jgi:hypothetical protein